MPSKKGQDQALNWLRSKAKDPNHLDAINAELCINVIMDLQRQYDQLGAKFNSIRERKPIKDERQISFFEEKTAYNA